MSLAPRHNQPTSAPKSPAARRYGKALFTLAIAVPTTIGSVGLAAPAQANSGDRIPSPPAASSPSAGTNASNVSTARTTAPAAPSSDVTVLSYGDSGSLVKTLQGRLDISQDGSFGPATRSAVKGFQSSKGLAVDGVVGPNTWEALGGFPTSTGGDTSTRNSGGETTSSDEAPSSSSSVVEIAKKYMGTPYQYGGSSPSEGFDCSGLTSYVFAQVGKDLPRTARAQQAAATPVSSPQPGDLVFYGYPAYHVGIYAGGGKMIDSPKPGTTVTYRDVYQPEVSGYGRV